MTQPTLIIGFAGNHNVAAEAAAMAMRHAVGVMIDGMLPDCVVVERVQGVIDMAITLRETGMSDLADLLDVHPVLVYVVSITEDAAWLLTHEENARLAIIDLDGGFNPALSPLDGSGAVGEALVRAWDRLQVPA